MTAENSYPVNTKGCFLQQVLPAGAFRTLLRRSFQMSAAVLRMGHSRLISCGPRMIACSDEVWRSGLTGQGRLVCAPFDARIHSGSSLSML